MSDLAWGSIVLQTVCKNLGKPDPLYDFVVVNEEGGHEEDYQTWLATILIGEVKYSAKGCSLHEAQANALENALKVYASDYALPSITSASRPKSISIDGSVRSDYTTGSSLKRLRDSEFSFTSRKKSNSVVSNNPDDMSAQEQDDEAVSVAINVLAGFEALQKASRHLERSESMSTSAVSLSVPPPSETTSVKSERRTSSKRTSIPTAPTILTPSTKIGASLEDIFACYDMESKGYLEWEELVLLISSHSCDGDAGALSNFRNLFNNCGRFTCRRFTEYFQICNRCTEVQKFKPGSQGVPIIVRSAPLVEEGARVKACEHFQWTWCPGFEVTQNPKCQGSNRHESCPKYLANCTLWKHRLPPKKSKGDSASVVAPAAITNSVSSTSSSSSLRSVRDEDVSNSKGKDRSTLKGHPSPSLSYSKHHDGPDHSRSPSDNVSISECEGENLDIVKEDVVLAAAS